MKPQIVSERNMLNSKQILTPTASHVNYSIQVKVRKYSKFYKHYKRADRFPQKASNSLYSLHKPQNSKWRRIF